jgi:hypothetical protein
VAFDVRCVVRSEKRSTGEAERRAHIEGEEHRAQITFVERLMPKLIGLNNK